MAITEETHKKQSFNGFLSTASYTLPWEALPKLTVMGRLSMTVMNQPYAEAWYSVKQKTEKLDEFHAHAGLRDVSLAAHAEYRFSRKASLGVIAENKLLLADAGQSPYTKSAYQLTAGLYLAYSF